MQIETIRIHAFSTITKFFVIEAVLTQQNHFFLFYLVSVLCHYFGLCCCFYFNHQNSFFSLYFTFKSKCNKNETAIQKKSTFFFSVRRFYSCATYIETNNVSLILLCICVYGLEANDIYKWARSCSHTHRHTHTLTRTVSLILFFALAQHKHRSAKPDTIINNCSNALIHITI